MPRFLGALVAAFLITLPAFAEPIATGWRIGHRAVGTRFVIDFSERPDYAYFTLAGPDRLVVDLKAVTWRVDGTSPASGGLVSAARAGIPQPGMGRLVIELAVPSKVVNAFVLAPGDSPFHRLVVDIEPTSRKEFMTTVRPSEPLSPAPPLVAQGNADAQILRLPDAPRGGSRLSVGSSAQAATLPVPTQPDPGFGRTSRTASVSVPIQPSRDDRPEATQVAAVSPSLTAPSQGKSKGEAPKDGPKIIVIDPGHGGQDPGATSLHGHFEKMIVLAMGLELKKQLEATGRYKVVMTRQDDTFIRLRDRVALARAAGASLFISLHADAIANHSMNGLSVYTLSEAASDREAEALAAKENKADVIAGMDLSGENPLVTNILIDLAQRETKNLSATFAGRVVDEIGKETPLLHQTHRFAGFAVLTGPDLPSVLIELGYLSNKEDEKKLLSPDHRAKLAKAVVKATDRFFSNGRLRRS